MGFIGPCENFVLHSAYYGLSEGKVKNESFLVVLFFCYVHVCVHASVHVRACVCACMRVCVT